MRILTLDDFEPGLAGTLPHWQGHGALVDDTMNGMNDLANDVESTIMGPFRQGAKDVSDFFNDVTKIGGDVLHGIKEAAGAIENPHMDVSPDSHHFTVKRPQSASPPNSGELRNGKRYRIRGPNPIGVPVEPEPPGEDPPSQSNSPAAPSMSSKRGATDGEEVTVVPPPAKISKIIPDYFTNVIPMYTSFIYNTANTQTNRINNHAVLLRLNSCWDPVVGTKSNRQPQGRDSWASVFNYYRVLQSNWKIRWHNNNMAIPKRRLDTDGNNSGFDDPLKGSFVCGYELVEDDTATLLCDNLFSFMTTKHAKRTELPVGTGGYTGNLNGGVPEVAMARAGQALTTISYTPESWDYHVQTNNASERWTPVNASPTVDHYAALRCFHKGGDDNQANKDNGIYIELYVEFVVQWREHVSSITKLSDSSEATGNDTAPNS